MSRIASALIARLRSVARHLPEFAKRSLRRRFGAAHEPASAEDERNVAYAARMAQETSIFAGQEEVHDLPPIFHYWSNRYLRPKLETFGFSNPDEFFATFLQRTHADMHTGSSPVRFASLGCGNCDTEVRVACELIRRGIEDFSIDCIDINETMLQRGRALADAAGVSAQIHPVSGDFNAWRPAGRYAAIMANQSLHHVAELEALFASIEQALEPRGRFIVSDMIGRNGHMRWPEALAIVHAFWSELPATYRYNVQLRRQEETFLDWDCSVEGFEGIRAQDILPLLIERFGFELFLPYANLVDPFIDRSFGPHFDANSEWDRAFIDRVHARDEAEIAAGTITPTHMMAVMRPRTYVVETSVLGSLTPRRCARAT